MKFVADEDVEAYLIDRIRLSGHSVYSIRENNSGISDKEVIGITNSLKDHILITCDRHFGNWIIKKGFKIYGIIYLRLHKSSKNAKLERITKILKDNILFDNCFTVIDQKQVQSYPINKNNLLQNIFVIIPAYNESASIAKVINAVPAFVTEVIVVNNASTDATAQVAENAGATVINEFKTGYGNACLKGIDYLKAKAEAKDIVVFLDGDFSDYPHEMNLLVTPIQENGIDMVIGSRVLGNRQAGSMMPQQIFGNWLATKLIRFFYSAEFTDLGPFRAIRWDSLSLLKMKDKTYGWTVEMQVKAAKQNLKCTEVAVSYRKRIGVSKVSGTIKGTVLAGYKILFTIFKNLK